jgi:hypothetical protein
MGHAVPTPPTPGWGGDSGFCDAGKTPSFLTVEFQGVRACTCSEHQKVQFSGVGGLNGGHVLAQSPIDFSHWSVVKAAGGTVTEYEGFGCTGDITDVWNIISLGITVKKIGAAKGWCRAFINTDKPSAPGVFRNDDFPVMSCCMVAAGVPNVPQCDGFKFAGGGHVDIMEHKW